MGLADKWCRDGVRESGDYLEWATAVTVSCQGVGAGVCQYYVCNCYCNNHHRLGPSVNKLIYIK